LFVHLVLSTPVLDPLKSPRDVNPGVLKIRLEGHSTNITSTALNIQNNTTLARLNDAKSLLATALAEIAAANKKRLDNPHRNQYTVNPLIKKRDGDTQLFAVNESVAAVAALVAEADAAAKALNGTLYRDYSSLASFNKPNKRFAKRATGEAFWMEQIEHTGIQPFGPDPNYKVSFEPSLIFQILTLQFRYTGMSKIMVLLEMESMMILQLLIWLSRMETAAA